MWVEELKMDLTERQLEIWEGRSGLSKEKEEAYRRRWRQQVGGTVPNKIQHAANGVKKSEVTPDDMKCPHRGEPMGISVRCTTCDKISLPVFQCDLHGECTIDRHARPYNNAEGKTVVAKCCKNCDDRPLPHRNGKSLNQIKKEKEREKEEEASKKSIALANGEDYKKQADAFLASLPPYPEERYPGGRGITIAAGGKYWASAFISARMLRHVGCSLPIQIWYLGDEERDERYEKLLSPFGVDFVNIERHPDRPKRRTVKGFGTKLFAAVHSPFSEVLSLDPDVYPVSNPQILFDDERYMKTGGIYWPDGEQTDQWTNWEFWGVEKRGTCGLETGMYVLDKKIAWEPMMLAEWYDDHAEWCYGGPGGHGGGDYGDKGPHRVAWAKLKRDFTIFNTKCRWEKFAFIQPGPDGVTPLFIHRCQSKFMAEGKLKFSTTPQHGENLRGGFPQEDVIFHFLHLLKQDLAKLTPK